MTTYICKLCSKEIHQNGHIMDLVEHIIDEHNFIELPHKALEHYNRIEGQ